MLITESWLSKDRKFSIEGFQVFRKDRQARGGWVAILVRKGLQANQVELDSTLEAVGIELEFRGSRVTFISVYVPPRIRLTEEDVKGLFRVQRTVVGGHFNAKSTLWGCRSNNHNGKILSQAVRNTRGLEVFAPEVATSIPTRGRGDILDIFLSFRGYAPWEVCTQFALNSDHFPVTAKIGGDPAKAKAVFRLNWEKLRDNTENLGVGKVPLKRGNLSEVAREFTREIQAEIKKCSWQVPPKKCNVLGLSREEKELIAEKSRAKRDWNKWRRDRDRRKLRALERGVKDMLVEARRRNF